MALEQPTDYPRAEDLPDSDGVPKESEWVCDQTRIYLIEPLQHYFSETETTAFVGGNSFVYYPPKAHNLGPDFHVVRGGKQRGQTKWVSWAEGGLLPTTVIEFLSESTEIRDRGEKFCIYRDVFKTEDYFLVDPDSLHIEGFHLSRGHYVSMQADPDGWFFVPSLGLHLGPAGNWIRLRRPDGVVLATGREAAEDAQSEVQKERARAEQESARAEQEHARAERERLRAEQSNAEVLRLKEQLRRLQA